MGSRAGDRPWLWQWPSLRMMKLGNGVRLGLLQASLGTTMEYYAGIDVSLESASLCVVDATGRIVREAKVASEPDCRYTEISIWRGQLGQRSGRRREYVRLEEPCAGPAPIASPSRRWIQPDLEQRQHPAGYRIGRRHANSDRAATLVERRRVWIG